MRKTRRKSTPKEGTGPVRFVYKLSASEASQAFEPSESSATDEEDWDSISVMPGVPGLEMSVWHTFLPPEVIAGFIGVSIGLEHGRNGRELWDDMMDFIGGVLRVEPGPEEKPMVDFIIKRFKDYYGEYDRTPSGILRVLADLGLIVISQTDGEKTIGRRTSWPVYG